MNTWDLLGGDAVMEPLLADFYRRIATSPIAPLFPPGVGEPGSETFRKQFAFQSDFWGGPVRYAPWRGHPRMRMRHLHFAIDQAAADTWMACMTAAVEVSAMPVAVRADYLLQIRNIAQAMINRSDTPGGSAP